MPSSEFRLVTPEEALRTPYPYVYAEDDGSVRELRSMERSYLEMPYHPGDGNRPYLKHTWDQCDGLGAFSGFVLRAFVPDGINIKASPIE